MLALAVMRRGGVFGIQVLAGCVAFIVLSLSLTNQLSYTNVSIIAAWMLVWCCAMVLRKTESQAAMTLAAGAFGTLFIVLIYVLVDDVPLWWQTRINQAIDAYLKGDLSADATAGIVKLKPLFALFAPIMNPFFISYLVIFLVAAILAGRWWQSRLFNPGGFRKEFYALQLPRPLIYLALAGIIMVLLGNEPQLYPVRDLLWLVIIMYLFQGLSSVHRLVQKRNFSSAWLVAMYCFLLIPYSHMIEFIACIGMADSWMRSKKIVNS